MNEFYLYIVSMLFIVLVLFLVLLKSGAHVDSKNNHRNTSLHFVANTGDEDGFFLLTLYAWGANENERTLFGLFCFVFCVLCIFFCLHHKHFLIILFF